MLRFLVVFSLLGLSSALATGDDIRVMSFNVRYGLARDGENHWDKRKDFVAETINQFDPDLLGTQETLEFQKQFLDSELKGYTSVGVGRQDGSNRGEMTAIFFKTDRFQKLDEGHFWLSTTPDVPGSIAWDSSLPRMASWVRLKDRQASTDRPILFLNTHFDHKGKVARQESATLIRAMAGEIGHGCDIVLTGDFNAAVDSKPYQALFDSSSAPLAGVDSPQPPFFSDTYRQSPPADAPGEATFSGFRAGVVQGARIDWIAVAGDWQTLAASIDRTSREGRSPSDHYPVTATLRQMLRKPQPLRVMSYNIKRGLGNDNKTDLLRAASRLDALNPDIVGLQEVDEGTTRSGQTDQAATLGERLQMRHAFGPFMDLQGGRYGLALLSKMPLEMTEVVKLPDGNEPRVAIASMVRWGPANQVAVVNIHLDWVKNDQFRFAQARALRKYLNQLKVPYLLMGDFNDRPGSRTLKLLSDGALEAKKPVEDRFTYSSTNPKMEIDFIFGYPAASWRFENVKVIDDPLTSDHRPVYAEAWLVD